GSVEIVVVHVRAVGVVVVEAGGDLGHRVGQGAAVVDLVIVGLLVVGGGQAGDLFVRLVAVDPAGVLVRLLAARQGQSQRCGCGDDHCRLLPHSHGFLFSSVIFLEVVVCGLRSWSRARRPVPRNGRRRGRNPPAAVGGPR